MKSSVKPLKHNYLIDEEGNKKAIIINMDEYNNLMELLEDLEDANDLLKAEREATSFIPYDKFRKTWLKE